MKLDTLNSYNYFISKTRSSLFDKQIEIGNTMFQYNCNSNIVFLEKDNKSLIVFGDIVDSDESNKNDKEIAEHLINSSSFLNLISRSKKMAGRYIIIYHSN